MQPPNASPARRSFFERWGLYIASHKWRVVIGAAITLALVVVATLKFGGHYQNDFSLPGTESQKASDLLDARFPARGGESARVVFYAEAGIEDPAVHQRIAAILGEAQELPGVGSVASPYDGPDAISQDGKTAFATVQYPDPKDNAGEPLVKLIERRTGDGLVVEAGGIVIQRTEQRGLGPTELVGVGAAAIILLIAFGSVVAMGVPLLAAIFSLGASLALLGVLTRYLGLSEFTPSFAAMIGLGVGIDYCLLVITRFRGQLHSGHTIEESIATAMNTAGRSVLFAGTVVIIALLGLTLMGVPFIGGLGVASAIVVVCSIGAALTLLPALLAILGPRVDSLAIPFLHTNEIDHHESVWFRLSMAIQRRPLWFIAGAASFLLLLAVPLLSMQTNFTDAGNNPTSSHTRRAYDLLSAGFGPGFNGPLIVVADLRDGGTGLLGDLTQALAQTPGVASAAPAALNSAGDTAVIVINPTTAPQDTKTNTLIHTLRHDVIPGLKARGGPAAWITGQTALRIDLSDQIGNRLPLFFIMVIGLSFVVLTIVFRSLVIPVKAALMNLLSIGSAYGVLVAVFQWGWFAGPLGIHTTGPIEAFLPMMMFAVLFGLSMDYEVFLVSRIHEERVAGASNSHAVAMGLSMTARVITSAALIMIAVFSSFILSDQRVIKEFGLGLSVAIFLDATVVRLLLVPAFMALFGDANWWLPAWLDRVIPTINIGEVANDTEDVLVA